MDDRSGPAATIRGSASPAYPLGGNAALDLVARATQGESAAGDDRRIDDYLAAESGIPLAQVDDLDHELIRNADPLRLDDRLSRLPHVNRLRHVPTLTRWLADAAACSVGELPREHAIAALRDVGMLLSSLRRHGSQPAAGIAGLVNRLRQWGALAGMVPRDTAVHYSLWNPVGARERHFTLEHAQESALIDSVRRSCRLLPLAAGGVARATRFGLRGAESAAALSMADGAVSGFGAAFAEVHHHVSPAYFAQELRPYFDPYDVDGTSWIGPAAAFIPLFLVTGRLYPPDEPERQMDADAKIYGRPLWRRAALRHATTEPLVRVVERGTLDGERVDAGHAGAVSDIMRSLVRFQGQHLTMARQSYAEQLTTYRHGSGGFPVTALKTITDDTRDIAHALSRERT